MDDSRSIQSRAVATATLATFATPDQRTVAGVANVAVANVSNHARVSAALLAIVGRGGEVGEVVALAKNIEIQRINLGLTEVAVRFFFSWPPYADKRKSIIANISRALYEILVHYINFPGQQGKESEFVGIGQYATPLQNGVIYRSVELLVICEIRGTIL